ncbi:hypothetical protein CORC01_12705 [Colletotrichum orchidophilum]|uniref:DRBM domain-containing protein n=1 Tax=Colletotrichum orchidophilum TaxID=1209926 RepID=A0A1G4AS66_9PEZI|nr:uncharacterized protein CORC01_12705 [Colletotrichum orchidophilum]OHE92014.1 hypothetical protein CORC01_12705 [Colletotrichum orchidophilum]
MAGSSPNGTAAQHVDWSALRSYIAGKEAFEAEHGRPAPLTDHEVSAIAILLRPAPRPEPDLGKTNWLGLLNHFQQVKNQKITFNDEARQEPGLGKAKELRWACSATFDSTGDVFPRPGYGMDPGEDISHGGGGPTFQGKKDAKQWAAKSACAWLIDNGHMMPSGELPKFPKPFAPAASAALAAAVPAGRSTADFSSAPADAAGGSGGGTGGGGGGSSGSVLPSKRSPPTESSGSAAAASRKKQDTTSQSPRSPSSSPTHASSVAAGKNDNSNVSSHQKPSSSSEEPLHGPRPTVPLTVMTSPASTNVESTTTSTASTPSLGAGAPITTTQSQVPTPAISPLPTPPESATSAERRVRDLCTQLHLPVPRYITTPDPALENFWDGRADFDGSPRIPGDLGTVRKILTKKAAKEKMAEGILGWLEAEVVKREQKAKKVLLGKAK